MTDVIEGTFEALTQEADAKAATEHQLGDDTQTADFSGNWVMDLSASDRLDDVLIPFGMPWLGCKLINNLGIKQHITHDTDRLRIAITTSVRSQVLTLQIQGAATHGAYGPLGVEVPTRTMWIPDGRLLTIQDCFDADGSHLQFCTERSLQKLHVKANGEEVLLERVYIGPAHDFDSASARAVRVLRRDQNIVKESH